MEKLLQLQQHVKAELEENPSSRQSDIVLIMGVFRRTGVDTGKSFAELAMNGELRQMESITRARRKVQAEHPELKNAETAAIRSEREQTFKEYAKA